MRIARRRWLVQAGVLVSSTAFPFRIPTAAAQSQSTLNALPRLALVIGNGKYPDAPLKNPDNDARSVASALQQLGFQVNLRLDAGRNDMIEAIRSFDGALARKKSVGLFYYAGHGAQLGWKNYLIPIDAAIEQLDDMQTKSVELNALLEGLAKAQNPMNVIILDACRDNPFGNKVRAQQKGLSQVDAPPGSLLAYATSPGNTASDGEGENGLYTENLLRELKVPEAKIEDVFKRVRLNVRRRSNGRQIPWESTSLEEDFYFIPPAQVKKLSEAELAKQFDEELAIWEKIKDSKEPGSLVAYLERYPSGKFSELAQFQLDRVLAQQGEKKIEVVNAPENPFTKGNARIDTQFKVGESWTYRVTDMFTKIEVRTAVARITGISDNEVVYNNGRFKTDLLGNFIKRSDGAVFSPMQHFIQEYAVGKKWTTRYRLTFPTGQVTDNEQEFKVVARENVTVPAGTFDAFHVKRQGWNFDTSTKLEGAYWIAPGVKQPIAFEELRKHFSGKVLVSNRFELVAYSQQ